MPEPTSVSGVTRTDRAVVYKGLVTTMHEEREDKAALAQLQAMPPEIDAQLSLDPDFLVTSAAIYSATGDDASALRLLNGAEGRYLFTRQTVPAGLQLQECYLLLNAGDDPAFYSHLLNVSRRPAQDSDLSEEQRNTLEDLWIYFALRRSSEEDKAGDHRSALRILIVAMETYPQSTLIKHSLAGSFLRAGDAKTALQLYKEAGFTDASPSDYQGAIGAAFATGDRQDARTWLQALLEKSPRDPQVLTLAAKIERAAGHRKAAAQYYRAALENMPKPKRVLLIPASVRDNEAQERQAPPSPLTSLAAVTDPGGPVNSWGTTGQTTISPWESGQSHGYGNLYLPGDRGAPVLEPLHVRQPRPETTEVKQQQGRQTNPEREAAVGIRSARAVSKHPVLRRRGAVAARPAATSLDSYSAQKDGTASASASPPYHFLPAQGSRKLGEYDPAR